MFLTNDIQVNYDSVCSYFSHIGKSRMGFMLSIPLYTINPVKFKFLQALAGLQLWRTGGKKRVSTLLRVVKLPGNKSISLNGGKYCINYTVTKFMNILHN